MKMKIVLIFLGLLPMFCFGESVIEGLAPEFKGEKVRVIAYQDFFSKTTIVLSTDSVDQEGRFELTVNNENYVYVKIQIKNYVAHLHLAPKSNYSVYFAAQGGSPNSFNKMAADLFFKDLDSADVNFLVRDYNFEYEAFFSSNYQLIAMQLRGNSSNYKKNKDWFKDNGNDSLMSTPNVFRDTLMNFERRLNMKYEGYYNSYFNSYYKYSLASMKLAMKVSRKKVFIEYLKNKPSEFDNIEYYNFINSFFDKYLLKKVIYKNENRFKQLLGSQYSLDSLRVLLAEDPWLNDNVLIDHLLIQGMFVFYRQQGYEKTHVAHVLGQIIKNGETAANRKMAQNILDILIKYKSGGKATDFALMDENEEIVKLSDFNGQYVFISFWESWCTTCENEMKMIKELNKRFGSKIKFITINIDENPDYMNNFLKTHKDYTWEFLHVGNQPEMTEVYEVKTLPQYYIVDKDKSFIESTGYRMTPDFTGFTMEFLLHKLYQQEIKNRPGPLGKRNY